MKINKQFYTFFTEDHHVPTLESNPFPDIDELYFSTFGISCILENLHPNKPLVLMRFLYISLSSVMKKLHQYSKLFLPRVLRTRTFQVTGSWQILFLSLRKAITI